MKKPLALFLCVLFVASMITVGNVSSDAETITFVYTFEKPSIQSVQLRDTIYDKVTLAGASSFGDPGEPYLPMKGAYILLPQDTTVKDISVEIQDMHSLGNGFSVLPTGTPTTFSQAVSSAAPVPDEQIYSSNELFPGILFSEVGIYHFRGYSILVLTLYPVHYRPLSGELFYVSDITLSVELKETQQSSSLYRDVERDQAEVLNRIDNPAILDTYSSTRQTSQVLDDYDLLILTVDEFVDEFQPLQQAHNEEGIRTEIKTLSDVGLFPSKVSSEDIRTFIRDEYLSHGIDYVLLGGDADRIPAQMLYVYGKDEDKWPVETLMPVDLYYACLDGPYNYDGDELWGETTDGENGGDVDLLAEVYVGRACADTEEEVTNFVDKTIAYLSTDFSDEYLREVLLAGEHLGNYGVASWGGNYLDMLINGSTADAYTTEGIPADKFHISKLYDRDWANNDWPAEEIIQVMNGGTHIINHDGHSYYGYNMKLFNSDVQLFTNEKYFFAYSVGCMAGGFDDPDGYDCFAEYLTVKTDQGAFATIMNARYGFFWSFETDGDGTRFTREFWDAVFGENIPVISKANQDSKEDNLYLIDRSCMRWTYYELNLFGDPAVALRLSTPPEKPLVPSGPPTGSPEKEYVFISSTTDADGDNIYYLFDWGDGSDSGWLGPYTSGDTCEATHSWTERGAYEIMVKAKDVNGAMSDWSDPLAISMSKTKDVMPSIAERFIKRILQVVPSLFVWLQR
ncbi:MAG: PKD domain-containing protein [Candidatus Thermoplasmatota archaeon]|nr:PKD domain-containing protein [Candidatus Thermoplasmatota archaeon]